MPRAFNLILLLLLILLLIFGSVIILKPSLLGFVGLQLDTVTVPQETGSWELHFCPRENCMQYLNNVLEQAGSVSCAFYSLNLFNTTRILEDKNALVFIDDSNAPSSYLRAYPIKISGLMHHKFCVLDTEIVTTGSFNPTFTSNSQDDNNLFIINSTYLTANYDAEIKYLAGKTVKTPYPKVMHDGFLIENYFCPRDNCESHVADAIGSARQSVYFMTFTFTSNKLESELVALKQQGLEVAGVLEKSQSANKDTFTILKNGNIDVHWDGNPHLMHHKVFIIDNSTVVFGSYNPTKAANTDNRENILIVHSPEIARKFLDEYNYVMAEAVAGN